MASRIAVVAGASSGIGAATARRLVADRFHMIAVARRADRLAAVVAELENATSVTVDITTGEGVSAILAAVDGPVELLVNTAAARPHHVNIDRLVVRPLAQAAQHKVHRG